MPNGSTQPLISELSSVETSNIDLAFTDTEVDLYQDSAPVPEPPRSHVQTLSGEVPDDDRMIDSSREGQPDS